MRNLKERRPDVGGIFLMLIPPMSSEVHVFSGGRFAVRRGASAIGATVEEGWFGAFELVGDASDMSEESESFVEPFTSGGSKIRLGFVIGIADFVTVREAMALARARWCGEREDRTI